MDIDSFASLAFPVTFAIMRMLLFPKLAAYLAKRSSILLTYAEDRWDHATSKCPEPRCASMLNSNEFGLVCESAKGDQHGEMVSHKTVVKSLDSWGKA